MRKSISLVVILILTSCASLRKLPDEQYYSFFYKFERTYDNGIISFYLKNPLMCPVNIKLVEDSINPNLKDLFGHITLNELQDTIIKVEYPNFNPVNKTKYVVRYGDFNQEIIKNRISLPFPQNKEYKIIQGYNGKFTHNTIFSQYAIDFNLKIGDTITSVDNGYVVGIIEDYKKFGTSKKWLENDKSNFITIYHPHSGLFTQYVHLDYKGALVELGDVVVKDQKIGISGRTGYTTTPHLHFNAKIPTQENGLISTEVEFEKRNSGKDL